MPLHPRRSGGISCIRPHPGILVPAPPRIRQTGDGPHAVLALHGWGGGHHTFDPIRDRLPASVRLFSVDLPGYGETPAPDAWTVGAMRDTIAAAIDQIDAPTVTLLGNCSGAIFGLEAALVRPDRIRSAVLIDPFTFTPWYFRLFLWPVVGRFFYRFTFANPIGRWITNVALAGRRDEDTDMTGSFETLDHDAVWQHLRLLDAIGRVDAYGALSIPVDVLHGERTFAAVRAGLADWRRIWPGVGVHELPGAGHLPLQESPDGVARVLADHIAGLGPA